MNKYHEFNYHVFKLIELNLKNQEQLYKKERKYTGVIDYAIQFASVHVNNGRRTGKTQFIVNASKEFGYENCIILASNSNIRDDIFKKLEKIDDPYVYRNLIICDTKNIHKMVNEHHRKFIFIDEPRRCFLNDIQNKEGIYNKFVSSELTQCFVLLGE